MTGSRRLLRCAVYTRKSSEEGLEQDFNSLEAQREACEAYIRSQTHEGCRLVSERFNDGGFSGGNLDRPALKRLLEQVRESRIDIIVIYKIDRLTRSLMDFAKLADLFEQQGVSFVSVTQQFNTTTSMGRLMLNVLLSFAQFEREITGERIRDKIAASKKKGIWMGGRVPTGYDVKNRALVVNDRDAKTVRTLFNLYLELKSVRKVWAEAKRLDLKTPIRIKNNGATTGGKLFYPGNIYQLLSSPIYIGKLPHKGQIYDGNHPPLIEPSQWEAVQADIATNRVDRRYRRNAKHPSPLSGLLYDAKGTRFTPTHTQKNNGQRYRYYVDPALTRGGALAKADLPRVPALEIEHAVRTGLARFLNDAKLLLAAFGSDVMGRSVERAIDKARDLATDILDATPMTWIAPIRSAIDKIVLREDAIVLSIRKTALRQILLDQIPEQVPKSGSEPLVDREQEIFQYLIPSEIRLSRSGAMKLVIGNDPLTPAISDPLLLKTIAKAHIWAERLKDSRAESVSDIARIENLTASYVTRVLRLGFLSPEIIEAVMAGRQPAGLTVDRLLLKDHIPLLWSEQANIFVH